MTEKNRTEIIFAFLEKTKEISRSGGMDFIFINKENRHKGLCTKEIIDCIAIPIWGKSKDGNAFIMMIVHVPSNRSLKDLMDEEVLSQIGEVGYRLIEGEDTKESFSTRLKRECEEMFGEIEETNIVSNYQVVRRSESQFGFKKTVVVRESENDNEIEIIEIEN